MFGVLRIASGLIPSENIVQADIKGATVEGLILGQGDLLQGWTLNPKP